MCSGHPRSLSPMRNSMHDGSMMCGGGGPYQPSAHTGLAPKAALGAAENLLAAELGPEVVVALRPHYGALLSVADLALGNPGLRVFLRHVSELFSTLRTAEAAAQHWRGQCTDKEEMLLQAHSQIEALRGQVMQERRAAQGRMGQLVAEARCQDDAGSELRLSNSRLEAELEKCQGECMRLGAHGIGQSQALAAEQAANMACSHEISRLRVELEVTGSMNKQNSSALEAARRQAASASLNADHSSQEQIRLEALLRHATKEQHAEMVSSTESATIEAARLRQKVDNGRGELQGVRNALSGMEGMWAELRSVSPCTAAVVGFLRDPETPAAKTQTHPVPQGAGGMPPVRIPVLALRWRSGAAFNTTPTWTSIRSGTHGVFHQLQSGAVVPEQVELAVCCSDGRWFCAREDDDYKFAALLMFQALHRDTPISATCRIGTVHALMNKTKADMADVNGLSVRSANPLWRSPPLHEEDFLRALMSDSPLREELEEFFYHRRRSRVEGALKEEARRDPLSIVDYGGLRQPTPSAPAVAETAPLLRPPPVTPAIPSQSRPRAVI